MSSTRPLHVLVAYGSKREGTVGIAQAIARTLRERGFAVDCRSADNVDDVGEYDAFVVGGSLYMFRWHRAARSFVARFVPALRERPVWFFSSGPLDDSATKHAIPPVRGVDRLMKRVKARGHITFGGRLTPDATGFIASAMAKKTAGDWRDWDQIRTWADHIADDLQTAPRAEARPVYAPARWALATLCFVVGIAAVFGGLGLALRPDGSLLRIPVSYLEHSGFESFLVPGLLLFGMIGIGHLAVGWLVLRHSEHADLAALVAGGVLTTWIVAEMVLLRTLNALHVGTLVVSALIIAEALRRLSSYKPPTEATS